MSSTDVKTKLWDSLQCKEVLFGPNFASRVASEALFIINVGGVSARLTFLYLHTQVYQ